MSLRVTGSIISIGCGSIANISCMYYEKISAIKFCAVQNSWEQIKYHLRIYPDIAHLGLIFLLVFHRVHPKW
jgi:hypothetical protein